MTNLVFTILGIDRGSKPLDDVGDAAERAADRVDGLGRVGTTVLPALAGAALTTGAVTGVALSGMSVLFGGLAIAATADSTVVKDAWATTAEEVTASVRGMAAPLADDMAGIAGQAQASFRRVRPLIGQAMEDAAEDVQLFSDGVLGLAERALPGMVTATDRATPAMAGLRSMLHSTGDGVSTFFTEVSEGSESSGRILVAWGEITENLLGWTGRLFGNLSNEGSESVGTFASVLEQVLDITGDLSEGSLPTLFTVLNGVLGVVDGLLGVVSPLSDELGTLLGVVLAVNAAAKAGTALSAWGRQLGTHMAEAGRKAGEAERRVGGLGSRLGMMAGLVGGPWGIAVTAGVGVLTHFASENAAAGDRVRGLTDALRESHGAITDGIRMTAAKALIDSDAMEKAERLGLSQALVTEAYLGNAKALDEVNKKANDYWDAFAGRTNAEIDPQLAEDWIDVNHAISEGNDEIGEARRNYEALNTALGDNAERTNTAAAASQRRQQALALEQLQVLAGVNAEYAMVAALQGVESARYSLVDAETEYQEAVKQHGKSSSEAERALLRQGQAQTSLNTSVLQAIAAAGEYAAEASGVTDEVERQRIAVEAGNEKALEMAATWDGPLPDALSKTVRSMGQAELAATGVTVSVDKAGNAVYRLPDGKTIKLNARDLASPVIDGIDAHARWLARQRYVATLTLSTAGNWGAATNQALRGVSGMLAGGGPVRPYETYLVGEEGPELLMTDRPGTVIPNDVTSALLNTSVDPSARAMAFAGAPAEGGAVAAVPLQVALSVAPGADSQLGELFANLVRIGMIRLVVDGKEVTTA